MTIFDGGRDLDLLPLTGAVTRTKRRRARAWRRAWAIVEIALEFAAGVTLGGLLVASALALWGPL